MRDLEGIVQLSGKDYYIERKLGSGGEGVSYLAIRDDEKKVLKFAVDVHELEGRLKPRLLLANSALNTRFKVHRHNGIYVVVEGDYVEGVNLREHIDNINRVYTEEEVVDFIKYMCNRWLSPLGSRGLVHRDIKPENIVQNETPNLIDFGSLKNVSGTMTLTTSVSGTPGYSRLFGDARVQDDFYSLARVASFLLTGKDPKFIGYVDYDKIESKKIVDALSVSDKLKNVLLRMQGVSEEYASPAEIVLDLEGRTNALVIARRKLPEHVTVPPKDLVARSAELVVYFVNNYQGFRPENKPLSSVFNNELKELLNFWGFNKYKWGVPESSDLLGKIFGRNILNNNNIEIVFEPTRGPFYFGFKLDQLNQQNQISGDDKYNDYYSRRNNQSPNEFSFIGDVIGCRSVPESVYALDSVILKHVLSGRPGFTYDDYPTKN